MAELTDRLRKYMSWPNDFRCIKEHDFKALMRAYDELDEENRQLKVELDDYKAKDSTCKFTKC